jgi:hypothetical protein
VLAIQHPARLEGAAPVSTVRHHYENQSDVEFLLHAVGRMWLAGARIDWTPLTVPDVTGSHADVSVRAALVLDRVFRNNRPRRPCRAPTARVDDWFYVPTWERTPFPTERPAGFWLVIADRSSAGLDVKMKLDARGVESALVWFGQRFHERFDGSFEVRPRRARGLCPVIPRDRAPRGARAQQSSTSAA